ncbi:MAG: adenylate/guanylate cyclase domain-containing protein [Actinomycetota bacterium]
MPRRSSGPERTLATVLFTDIVGSTERAAQLGDRQWKTLLDQHHKVVRGALKRYNGREIDTAGDGFFATFDRPANAIECAGAMIRDLRKIGIQIRAGAHMGEVERMGAKVGGMAVHIGSRVASKAGACEVLVSSTIKDLVTGADFRFLDRGAHELKGVPGEWRIFAVDLGDLDDLGTYAPPAQTTAAQKRPIWRSPALAGAGGALILVLIAALVIPRGGSSPVPGENAVGRIDSSAAKFTAAFTVGTRPVGLAIGAGALFVINASDQTVTRVNPTTGKTVTKGVGGTPTGVAFGADALWVTTQFGLSSGSPGSVLRLDPNSLATLKSIEAGNGVRDISFGENAVWATNVNQNLVVRIDPSTNSVAARIPVGESPEAIAVGNGSVWVANTLDDSISRIDPKTSAVAARIPLRSAPTAIATAPSGIWVVSAPGNTVTRIDASTNQVATTIMTGAKPTHIAAGAQAVWITESVGGEVLRVDARTNRITARLRPNGHPDNVIADGRFVWVSVHAL